MNIRQIALRILDEYEAGGKYINLALSSHLTDGLGYEERAALTALLYTAVEYKLSYDYYILALAKRSENEVEMHTRNILRLGLCQLLHMRSIPSYAAVNETVKLARTPGERAFVNGVLRAAERQRDNLPMPDEKKKPLRYLSVKYSFPLGTVKLFDSLYGREATEEMLRFFNEEKYTDISVNTTKISAREYQRTLAEAGVFAEENGEAETSLRIFGSVNPERLPGFDLGHFFVQDRASAICASLLAPKDGDVVIDVCSAPGGKSFATAIRGGDRLTVHSFDLHESKLSLIQSGAERLGLKSINVAPRDATSPDESLAGKADFVICDAPCSGLGVLGKKADLRYKDLSALDTLPPLQLEILTRSASYLKVGGEMVYSTCTLNPDENLGVVNSFLSANPSFATVPFTVGSLEAGEGHLTLLPHIHGTDGFFMAKIVRKA